MKESTFVKTPTQANVGPDTRVTVPVWLAGAGETETVFDLLADWNEVDGEPGHMILEHPAGGLFVGFLPERRAGYDADAVWEVTAYAGPVGTSHLWRAVFGAQVPAEAIAVFIAAACDPAGTVRHPDELPDRRRR